MDRNQEIVEEILELGARKKTAYYRLDELETELRAGGTLPTLLRAIWPSESSKSKREELDSTVGTIERLRRSMDDLRASLPSERLKQVDHLWSIENTTNLRQLRQIREAQKDPG